MNLLKKISATVLSVTMAVTTMSGASIAATNGITGVSSGQSVSDSSSDLISPKVSAITSTSFNVSWNRVSESADASYALKVLNVSTGKYEIYEDIESDSSETISFSVTGLTPGTAYYVVVFLGVAEEYGGYTSSADFSVVTPPSDVTGMKMTSNAPTSISMSWTKVPEATGYVVYREIDGKWQRFKVTSGTTATATGLEPGTNYRFTVRAYKTVEGKNYYSNKYTAVTMTTTPAKPAAKMTVNTPQAIRLEWDKVTGATGYVVYQKVNGKWEKKYVTKNGVYVFTNLANGTDYDFAVRAYRTFNGKNYYSPFATSVDTVKACTKPAQVSMKGATSISQLSYKLNWNAVKGASYYEIYKSVDGKWVKVTETTALSYNATGLQAGKGYSWCVRAVKKFNGQKYYGAYSSPYKAYTAHLMKAKSGYAIRSGAGTSYKKLYTTSAQEKIYTFGAASNSWIKVRIPNTTTYGYMSTDGLYKYNKLSVPTVDQTGTVGGVSLPSGCESAALATILNRLGFSATKNQIAYDYVKLATPGTCDPNYAFPGNPNRMNNSYGVFAPAIAQAANKYLKDKGQADNYAIELNTDYYTGNNVNNLKFDPKKLDLGSTVISDGLTLSELKNEIDRGHPCVIWMATSAKTPYVSLTWTLDKSNKYTNDGSGTYKFKWVAPQHCVVLQGYDDYNQVVYIGDVWGGYTRTFSYYSFMKGYEMLGRQTVVIYKK